MIKLNEVLRANPRPKHLIVSFAHIVEPYILADNGTVTHGKNSVFQYKDYFYLSTKQDDYLATLTLIKEPTLSELQQFFGTRRASYKSGKQIAKYRKVKSIYATLFTNLNNLPFATSTIKEVSIINLAKHVSREKKLTKLRLTFLFTNHFFMKVNEDTITEVFNHLATHNNEYSDYTIGESNV